MVFDNEQSIYGFRGANVDYFCQTLINEKFEEFRLERNYRSTGNIVKASNSVVKYNNSPIQKEAWTSEEDGAKIQIKESYNPKKEADNVVRTIFALRQNGIVDEEICVLARTKAQFNILEKALLRNRINYNLVSGMPFCSRVEVKDMLHVLGFILNGRDEDAFARIVNIPKSGIGEASLNKLLLENDCDDIMDRIAINKVLIKGKARKGIDTFIDKFNQLKEYAAEEVIPAAIITKYLELFPYEEHLISVYDEVEAKERMQNVRTLIQIVSEYETIEDVLNSLLEVDDSEVDEEEMKHGVNLMTIHASKGLEFDAVIIIGGNESIFPHFRSLDEIKDIQEERRLWYVAMTRAKKVLLIFYVKLFVCNGTAKFLKPSRFIKEINEQYKVISTLDDTKAKQVSVDEVF